jgi:hypothetical protein
MSTHADSDEIFYGAKAIGKEKKITNEDGSVNIAKTNYHLKMGHIPAAKMGRLWWSRRSWLLGSPIPHRPTSKS